MTVFPRPKPSFLALSFALLSVLVPARGWAQGGNACGANIVVEGFKSCDLQASETPVIDEFLVKYGHDLDFGDHQFIVQYDEANTPQCLYLCAR